MHFAHIAVLAAMLAAFNWGIFSAFLQPLVQVGTLALGTVIAAALHTSKDHARAASLSIIANEAAALVTVSNPNANWAQLLSQTISQISNASGLPTKNEQAITRAATAALANKGIKPNV